MSLDDIKRHDQVHEGSGSAWMFHNHYNPEVLKAVRCVMVGDSVDEVIEGLVEGAKLDALRKALKKKAKVVGSVLQQAFDAPERYRVK